MMSNMLVAAAMVASYSLLCSATAVDTLTESSTRTVYCYPACLYGQVCAGTSGQGRCVRPMGVNGKCGQDPYWVCRSGLECREGVCMRPLVPLGRRCTAAGSQCVEGLACVSVRGTKRCVKPGSVGERCRPDSTKVCEESLSCIDNRCASPPVHEGGSCLAAGSVCEDGLVCAGTAAEKKCVRVMQLGGKCKNDPFWICAEGLECRGETCVKPEAARGESCVDPSVTCAAGLVCAGTAAGKKCVVPMTEGKSCGKDPWWVCAEGLECRGDICKKPEAARGESCVDPSVECASGLVCAGSGASKKCVVPMTEGKSCGQDPLWVCVEGLECRGSVCKKPQAGKGESCLPEGTECADGLVCAGTSVNKKCVEPMGSGGKCGQDPFWICAEHLKCEYGYCH